MLKTDNLGKTYPNGIRAVQAIKLKFPDRGMVFLLGKSGSGKSTLMNILGGIDTPSTGKVIYGGAELTKTNVENYRKSNVSFIYQNFSLLNDLTIARNVSLAGEVGGRKLSNEDAEVLLNKVGLSGYGGKSPDELSGGEMQRVAIARALVKENATIFADEPTGNLDSKNGKMIFTLLKEISRERLVVVVSHDEASAQEYADYVVRLKDGFVVESTLKDFYENDESVSYEIPKARGKGLSFKSALALGKWTLGKKKGRYVLLSIFTCFFIMVLNLSLSLTTLSTTQSMLAMQKDAPNRVVYIRHNRVLEEQDYEFLEKECSQLATLHNFYLNQDIFFDRENAAYGNDWEIRNAVADVSLSDMSIQLVHGREAEAFFEVVIPRILADNIIGNGFIANAKYEKTEVNSYEDLIGKAILAQEHEFKIVGIFEDNSTIPDEYRVQNRERGKNERKGSSEFKKYELANSGILDKTVFLSPKYKGFYANFLSESYAVNAGDRYNSLTLVINVFEASQSAVRGFDNIQEGEIIIGKQTALPDWAVGDTISISYYKNNMKVVQDVKIVGFVDGIRAFMRFADCEKIYSQDAYRHGRSTFMFNGDTDIGLAKTMENINSYFSKKYDKEEGQKIVFYTDKIGIVTPFIKEYMDETDNSTRIIYACVASFLAILTLGTIYFTLKVAGGIRQKSMRVISSLGAGKIDICKIYALQALLTVGLQMLIGLVLAGVTIPIANIIVLAGLYEPALRYTALNFFVPLATLILAVVISIGFQLHALKWGAKKTR